MSPALYLVIDLEATCDKRRRIPRDQTEIIELGAVLVDAASLEPIGELSCFVKPVLHPVLTPFCTKLTSIVQADVANAGDLPSAIEALRDFIAGRDVLFCSWGDYDREQLTVEMTRHGVVSPLGERHLNLKQAFMERMGDGKPRGLNQALRTLGLRFEGTAHRGIDDARNTARLLPFVLGRATDSASAVDT